MVELNSRSSISSVQLCRGGDGRGRKVIDGRKKELDRTLDADAGRPPVQSVDYNDASMMSCLKLHTYIYT